MLLSMICSTALSGSIPKTDELTGSQGCPDLKGEVLGKRKAADIAAFPIFRRLLLLQLDFAYGHIVAVDSPGNVYLDVFRFLHVGNEFLRLLISGLVKLDHFLVRRQHAVAALLAVGHL